MTGFQNLSSSYISRVVKIGNVALGGENPIRIQSMTSTDTLNTKETVNQSIRMIEAGCELVRITCPGMKEAENLKTIKKHLHQAGYQTPIIADIHFNAKVAEYAAKIAEKIRINPGNYTGAKAKIKSGLSEFEYQLELEKTAENLFPLLKICKEYGTVIRVGVNHGSLSERIINKYGNTPEGMVASAMEFVKICQNYHFQDLVLSMKSSNLKIMIQAYRLLVHKMQEQKMDYPLHLGITEAGNDLDGRIKSTAGIGTLLREGIGDTIRVSLTEDPVNEIIFAKSIVKILKRVPKDTPRVNFPGINPFEYHRRKSNLINQAGGGKPPLVISSFQNEQADFIYNKTQNSLTGNQKSFKIYTLPKSEKDVFNKENQFIEISLPVKDEHFKKILQNTGSNNILVFTLSPELSIFEAKKSIALLMETGMQNPVIVRKFYNDRVFDDLIVRSSTDFGSLLADGLIDGIWIENSTFDDQNSFLAFRILQASGSRISSTEFIACPSCGRTKYNIQKAFEEVKKETSHLCGLKIAVMGCVVNGPGEMADADYGYIGAGNGKVNLYKSGELAQKGIDEKYAIRELIALIKKHGDWKEKN